MTPNRWGEECPMPPMWRRCRAALAMLKLSGGTLNIYSEIGLVMLIGLLPRTGS